MTKQDFTVGDSVENSFGVRGRVTDIEGSTVHVHFTDRGGNNWNGIFDDVWFKRYPDMLKKIAQQR